jgi:hypothetical protein
VHQAHMPAGYFEPPSVSGSRIVGGPTGPAPTGSMAPPTEADRARPPYLQPLPSTPRERVFQVKSPESGVRLRSERTNDDDDE